MIALFFCLITLFLSSSLVYGDEQSSLSPEIQKKIDATKQAEERIHQKSTPASPKEQSPPKELPPPTTEQILKEIEKKSSKQPSTTPKELPPETAEQILEEIEKKSSKQPSTTPKGESKTTEDLIIEELKKKESKHSGAAPQENPCDSLSQEEQAFANTLGPSHKKVFCKKFSLNLRKMAMNMTGKVDAKGGIISPSRAVDIVATEHDIDIPFTETENWKKEAQPTTPQMQKENP